MCFSVILQDAILSYNTAHAKRWDFTALNVLCTEVRRARFFLKKKSFVQSVSLPRDAHTSPFVQCVYADTSPDAETFDVPHLYVVQSVPNNVHADG